MPTEAKKAEVAELVELLSGSHTAIVSDYRGLTVADLLKVADSSARRASATGSSRTGSAASPPSSPAARTSCRCSSGRAP